MLYLTSHVQLLNATHTSIKDDCHDHHPQDVPERDHGAPHLYAPCPPTIHTQPHHPMVDTQLSRTSTDYSMTVGACVHAHR